MPVEMMMRCLLLSRAPQRRQQVGERLARPRAGLDDQVPPVREACSIAFAIAYCPGRCSNASEDCASRPPGWKKSCSVGSFPLRAHVVVDGVSGGSGVTKASGYRHDSRRFFADCIGYAACRCDHGRRQMVCASMAPEERQRNG